jgi:hypothetical protein
MAVPALLQVIAAVVIVVLLLIVAYIQYDKEKIQALRESGQLKKEIVIFQGIKDFKTSKDEVYDTVDKSSGAYRNMSNSVNQESGIEYSYNFWLYLDQTNLVAITGSPDDPDGTMTFDGGMSPVTTELSKSPIILFMRGDPNLYSYKSSCNKNKLDILVKNPIVKLEHGADVLSVEFNTVGTPDAVKNCDTSIADSWEAANGFKVGIKGIHENPYLDKKWFMVTIVIQETVPTLSLAARYQTQCSIYINGALKTSQRVQGRIPDILTSTPVNAPVRQPTGNFYVNRRIKKGTINSPTYYSHDVTAESVLMMANLSYFNYALDGPTINGLFTAQFSRKPAPAGASSLMVQFDGDSGADVSTQFDDSMPEIDYRA